MKRWLALLGSGRRPGQTLVMFALMITVLIGFVGLSIDVGYLLSQRRAVQNAADAAAMAGGNVLATTKPVDTTTAQTVALTYATTNDNYYHYDPTKDTVTTSIDESADQMTVTITHQVTKFFIGVLYSGPWRVTATATAKITPVTLPFALIALGQSTDCSTSAGNPNPGMVFDGGGGTGLNLSIQGGGIGSNGCITVKGNSFTGSVGGVVSAHGAINDSFTGNFTVTDGWTSAYKPLIPDPYNDGQPNPTDLTPPPAVCSTLTQDPPIPAPVIQPDGSQVINLAPGQYTSKSNLNFSGGGGNLTVKLAAGGSYCFSTDLKLNGSGTTLDGSAGSFLYVAPGSILNPGNANVTLTAIGTAPNNVVIWVNNENSDGSCDTPINTLGLDGGGNVTIDGVIYAPCSTVNLGGNSGSATVNGIVIGNDINLHGNVTINVDANRNYQSSPKQVFLVQ